MSADDLKKMKRKISAGEVKGAAAGDQAEQVVQEAAPAPAPAPDPTRAASVILARGVVGIAAAGVGIWCNRNQIPGLSQAERESLVEPTADLLAAYGIDISNPKVAAWLMFAGAVGPIVMDRGDRYLAVKAAREEAARQVKEAAVMRPADPPPPVPPPTDAPQSYVGA